MKQLMITVKPEHLVNILNGSKKLELRSYIPKDFEGWVNVVCGKGGKRLVKWRGIFQINDKYVLSNDTLLNGKVVARFWFDEYSEIIRTDYFRVDGDTGLMPMMKSNGETYNERIIVRFRENYEYDECKESGLTTEQLKSYGKGKDLYAWHIKKLEIFDTPKELGEFYTATQWKNTVEGREFEIKPLTHAPQKYTYCYRYKEAQDD